VGGTLHAEPRRTDPGGLLRAIANAAVPVPVVAGCTATKAIDPGAPARLAHEVKPDDRVSIASRDGRAGV
jgi:hypothetical protein